MREHLLNVFEGGGEKMPKALAPSAKLKAIALKRAANVQTPIPKTRIRTSNQNLENRHLTLRPNPDPNPETLNPKPHTVFVKTAGIFAQTQVKTKP